MTPIHRHIITERMAWRGSDLKSKDDIAFDLASRHVAALKDLLARNAALACQDISFQACRHPALDEDLHAQLREIQQGRGVVMLRGLPVAEHSREEAEKLCWMAGMHFGAPLSQNSLGQRMVPVQEERQNGGQSVRANKSNQELALHCDETEIFALFGVRAAMSGGQTQIISSLSLHNEVVKRYPEILPLLYRGFPYHRRGEQPDHQPMVTPHDVPVFSTVDGIVSCMFIRHVALAGMRALGREPSEEELRAMNILRDIALELQFECVIEPGEALVANNYTTLHSRSEFESSPEAGQGRLLLRLWLEPRAYRRPVVPQIRIHQNEHGRAGVDPIPGRKMKGNEYIELPEEEVALLKSSRTDS